MSRNQSGYDDMLGRLLQRVESLAIQADRELQARKEADRQLYNRNIATRDYDTVKENLRQAVETINALKKRTPRMKLPKFMQPVDDDIPF